MQNNRLTANAQTFWSYIRTDLNTLARYYSVNWNSTNSTTTSGTTSSNSTTRVSDSTLQALMTRIASKTEVFKLSTTRALNRNTQNNTGDQDRIFGYITDFENGTNQLRQNFNARRTASTDVQDVLSRAVLIDNFVRDNGLNPAAQRDWTSLKADLDTLAGYYNVSSTWNQTTNVDTTGNSTLGTTSGSRVSEGNVRTLLTRLQTRTDSYKRELRESD